MVIISIMKRTKKLTYILIMFFALAMTSCVTNYTTRYLQNRDKDYKPYVDEEYTLKPQDEINIRMFTTDADASKLFNGGAQSNGANMVSYKIYDDGTIDLPYLKKVKVEGMTIRECSNFLTEKLKDYTSPDLFVKVTMARKVYYVIGESGKGEKPFYKDKLNIFEALAQCGDLTTQADRKRIKIIRNVDGEEKIIKFDIRSKDILDSEYYYIKPNDIIFVPQTPGSFFKITSFSSFLGVITSSLPFVLLVVQYATQK